MALGVHCIALMQKNSNHALLVVSLSHTLTHTHLLITHLLHSILAPIVSRFFIYVLDRFSSKTVKLKLEPILFGGKVNDTPS